MNKKKKKKKKKKERKTFWLSGDFLVWNFFVMLFRATWRVVGHKALENEGHIVIKAYKFIYTIYEI